MLKTPYTLITGHGKIMVLVRRLPPCLLAFTVLEGVEHAAWAEAHYLALNPLNYNSDQHDKTCPWI